MTTHTGQPYRSRRELGVLLGGKPTPFTVVSVGAHEFKVGDRVDIDESLVSPAAPEARSGISALLAVARSLFKWKP